MEILICDCLIKVKFNIFFLMMMVVHFLTLVYDWSELELEIAIHDTRRWNTVMDFEKLEVCTV